MSNGSKSGKSSTGFHFLAGLTSGISTAILLQPADLLKTRLQQPNSLPLLPTIRSIASTGLLSFWRGTLPSALRTGFGSAIYFTSLNTLRQSVARSNILRPGATNTHSSSLPKLSAWANLGTGAVARAGAGFVLMPMTVIKVRYESNVYAYKSIAGASKDILATEGLRGFFSGFGATAIRDAPYAGLYVLFYESLKAQFSLLSTTLPLPGQSMAASTSATINFTSGILAAGLATAITNPFDAIKTRIQLEPRVYRNVVQGLGLMVRRDGWRCLADGLGLRMGRKAVSSALAWTVYEESVRRAERVWKAKEGAM